MYEDTSGDFLFTIAPIFISLIFIIVFAVIVFSVIKSVSQWKNNNQMPRLNVKAKVVSKRTQVRGGGETSASTDYYVTFEVESGDRMELEVQGTQYGTLAEGDEGNLGFQGTRFLHFRRNGEMEFEFTDGK